MTWSTPSDGSHHITFLAAPDYITVPNIAQVKCHFKINILQLCNSYSPAKLQDLLHVIVLPSGYSSFFLHSTENLKSIANMLARGFPTMVWMNLVLMLVTCWKL